MNVYNGGMTMVSFSSGVVRVQGQLPPFSNFFSLSQNFVLRKFGA